MTSTVLSERPLRMISIVGAISAILAVALVVTQFGFVGYDDADTASGHQYEELLQAARVGAPYKVGKLFDALASAGVALLFLAFALHERPRAPARAAFLGLASAGVFVASIGAYATMNGTMALASQWNAATPAARPAIQSAFLATAGIEIGAFQLGQLAMAFGYASVIAAIASSRTMPRWLAWLAAVPLVASVGLFSVGAIWAGTATPDAVFVPFFMAEVMLGMIAFPALLAIRARRAAHLGAPAATA